MKGRSPPPGRRQIFVLTPEEKRTVAVVLIMFVLGLATAHYRAAHALPPSKTAVNEVAAAAARPAQKRTEARQSKAPK